MRLALSLGIVILEELALVIASILLIGLLAVWVISDATRWLYDGTVYRIYIDLRVAWDRRNWGKR